MFFDLNNVKKELSAVKNRITLQFSGGTYQGEWVYSKRKEHFWPFLQLDDAGEVIDGFCSCSSEKHSCEHLRALYLCIFSGHKEPLHVRFRHSFWNRLCQIAFNRHASTQLEFKKSNGQWQLFSPTGKLLFSIKGLKPSIARQVKGLFFERKEETEETSLKFFNLPEQELIQWRAGKPSLELSYELSCFSDLAKWLMQLQEYEIEFQGEEDQLPHFIRVRFGFSLQVGFYITLANWPSLIPTLNTVESPLKAQDFRTYQLKSLFYDPDKKILKVTREKERESSAFLEKTLLDRALVVGEWLFIPQKGFYPKSLDPLFDCEEIPLEKIGFALKNYAALMQKYCTSTPIHLTPVPAQYALSLDADHQLHIVSFVFEKGDLQKPQSVYFGPWVYLQDKGFYLLKERLFDAVEKVIPHLKMSEFINRHRAWLGGFEGFQTHIYQLESHLKYHFTQKGELVFEAIVEMLETQEGMVDFGEWIYFPGRGFFAKKRGRGIGKWPLQTPIRKDQIASFIRLHTEELEMIPGFFASQSPLERCGLKVFLNETDHIVIQPEFVWRAGYQERNVRLFGDFTFVESEGFCELPASLKLPEKYWQRREISKADEPYFVLYELETLSPYILSLDPKLKVPSRLEFSLDSVEQKLREGHVEWVLRANMQSEKGSASLLDIASAIQEGRRYLFSSAGCILLNAPRFNWLKSVTKRQWLKGKEQLKLSGLQWMRLCAFEGLDEKQAVGTLPLLEGELSLEGLKSNLRSYQEVGVKWLFSLFVQQLSGLLCDEMGLGKTHQAMGLIAAICNSQDPKKILIVCPTSVIYHWEALLQEFLPKVSALVFYGISRSLSQWSEKKSILLTSYGTLRSEIKTLCDIPFDLAIFDELQVAKNSRSQTHKALRRIKAHMRLGLTGTPVENRLSEIKALFDVILPGYLPTESQFRELFVTPIEKYQDQEKKQVLSRLVRPFILRRKKSEVLLELPEKIEEISYCPLSDEQKALYGQVCSQHKDRLIRDLEDEERPVPYLHVFSLLSQLKQICDHPCLVTKDFAHFHRYKSGKWDLFVELLQEIRDSNQKVVIFSQYLDMLNLMQMHLDQENIGYASIRGSTRNRKEQLDKFKQDPRCEVFLASLQAVGMGVDLVSASVVIHYDRWWNPARENQATDRVHRMGQNRGVQVFKLVTKGTIEEHIHHLIERKKTLMEGVIGFDEHDQVKRFTREDLLTLLKHIETSTQIDADL